MERPGSIEPEGVFDGLSGGAIALGAFVDLGATILGSLLLLGWLAPAALGPDEAEAAEALAAHAASDVGCALELALGIFCTALGAFVGARRAGRLHVRHGGWIAVASTAGVALLMLLTPPDAQEPAVPLWCQALAWILIIPAGVSGGALAGLASEQG